MWQTYYSPRSLDEALHLLAERGPAARPIAGGTHVINDTHRGIAPAGTQALIDLTRIPGLAFIEQDGQQVRIGPLALISHLAASDLLAHAALPLAQAARLHSVPQLRNRATIGGAVAQAENYSDVLTALLALGAHLTLRSAARGERSLHIDALRTPQGQVDIQPDELITAIHVPMLEAGRQRGAFIKLGGRRAFVIAAINAAVVLEFNGDVISGARLAFGCVAPTHVRLGAAEEMLTGRPLDERTISEAAQMAGQALEPISDERGSSAYRRQMLSVLTERLLSLIMHGAEWISLSPAPPSLLGMQGGQVHTPLSTGFQHVEGTPIETTINGTPHVFSGPGVHHKTLLALIREEAGLTGTKPGCDGGECGTCSLWLDGMLVNACQVYAPRAHHAQVVTIEGLAADPAHLHPVQQAFIDQGAVQCGYCTPGFVMSAAKLLEEHPQPQAADIRAALTGNLCRCTGYYKIIAAVEQAAQAQQE